MTCPDSGLKKKMTCGSTFLLLSLFFVFQNCGGKFAPNSSLIHTFSQPNLTACANTAVNQDALGIYSQNRGQFYLQDSDQSFYTQTINFGPVASNWLPITGDWSKSGSSSIGLYDPANAMFYLKNQTTSGNADIQFVFGSAGSGQRPVAGDWTGQGMSTVGVYDPNSGNFLLKNSNSSGPPDLVLPFGSVGTLSLPIAGDWQGDGMTRVGLYVPSSHMFYLRKNNDPKDKSLFTQPFLCEGSTPGSNCQLSATGAVTPVAGRWSISAQANVGLAGGTAGTYFLLLAANTTQNPTYGDILAPLGMQGANVLPVIGRWAPSHCRVDGQNTSPSSPSWMQNMVLYWLRIETFNNAGLTPMQTPLGPSSGTFQSAAQKLSYLSNLGVTAIMITPVATSGSSDDVRFVDFYGPSQPDVLDPRLGTDQDFANFVAQAHNLGMKVIVDNVLHGIAQNSPYLPTASNSLSLPSDWFGHLSNGQIALTSWGTEMWDWTSTDLQNWWIQNIGIGWVQKYDIDGFRLDLEPTVAGTPLWNRLRNSVLSATGKQIVLIPETAISGRGYTFDFPQTGIGIQQPTDFFSGTQSFVDFVQSSPENFYSSMISPYANYGAQGQLSGMAYGAILSPLIPQWWMGEEFNATADYLYPASEGNQNLYFSQLDWSYLATNTTFFAQVKKLIQIRNQYATIFSLSGQPLDHAQIVNVTNYSGVDLPPYTMYRGLNSITVIASRTAPSGAVTVTIPLSQIGVDRFNTFQVTDLLAGRTSVQSKSALLSGLTFSITQGGVIPLLVTALK